MAEAMLWNKARTQSVRATKVRSFGIYPDWRFTRTVSGTTEAQFFNVTGWYNSNDSFDFGRFDTEEEARMFLEALHKQIEGKEE